MEFPREAMGIPIMGGIWDQFLVPWAGLDLMIPMMEPMGFPLDFKKAKRVKQEP